MAIKYEKITPGMRLYDYHSYRCGNTTFRAWSNWSVDVKEVRDDGCIVSWNNNRDEFFPKWRMERLRAKPGKEKNPFAR